VSGEARATVQLDDGRIRVTRYDMAPGHRISWHRHQRDAGAEHELVNGARPYSFIEIEFTTPRSR
jgi:hypothetical protein